VVRRKPRCLDAKRWRCRRIRERSSDQASRRYFSHHRNFERWKREWDITVAAPINWSPNSVLRLQALRDVNINANLTATGNTAGLVLGYGTGRDYMLATGVKVTLSGSAQCSGSVWQVGKTWWLSSIASVLMVTLRLPRCKESGTMFRNVCSRARH